MSLRVSFLKARKVILLVFVLVGLFASGYYLGVNGYRAQITKSLRISVNRQLPADKNVDMSLFWQVWDLMSEKYYDKSKLVPAQMVYGAIEGMVASAKDPYTAFLPPAQNKIVNENLNGSFGGVGIEIGYKKGHLAVIAPLPGTPAEKAGVKAGDYIVRISDKAKNIDLESSIMNTSDAVTYIRGTEGTIVTLTLLREGSDEPIIVDIAREKINVPSVIFTWVGDNSDIAKIKISEFGGETKKEWDKAVTEINTKCQVPNAKCGGVIIDLRNNPGGYMQAAIDLASDFVPTGSIVVIQQSGDGSKEEYKSGSLPRLGKYKAVVLINEGSASASEILAGALRDILKIQLVGDKSFGKGTIQEPIDMTGGAGVHVTTAKWLTPNGTWVHEKGLTPDVVIANPDNATEDAQLKAAIGLF
jgi:carboxyl-terminal processing protease